MIPTYDPLKKNPLPKYPTGTEGWGFAFKLNKNGKCAQINMKPTWGVLTAHYNKYRNSEIEDPNAPPLYFVPLKKTGLLRWKKHSRLDLIGFTPDLEEARRRYDELVTYSIWRQFKQVQALTQYYINDPPKDVLNLLRLEKKREQHNLQKGGKNP